MMMGFNWSQLPFVGVYRVISVVLRERAGGRGVGRDTRRDGRQTRQSSAESARQVWHRESSPQS